MPSTFLDNVGGRVCLCEITPGKYFMTPLTLITTDTAQQDKYVLSSEQAIKKLQKIIQRVERKKLKTASRRLQVYCPDA